MDDQKALKALAKLVLTMRNHQVECEIAWTPEAAALKVRAEAKVDHCLDMILPESLTAVTPFSGPSKSQDERKP